MGCDIHAAVEYLANAGRDGQAEWWRHAIDAAYLPRDYWFFGCLVKGHPRADVPGATVEARGLPQGKSDIVNDVKWWQEHPNDHGLGNAVCYADHTLSWLTTEEYRAAIALYAATNPHGGTHDPEYIALADYMDSLEKAGCAARLIFGFDN